MVALVSDREERSAAVVAQILPVRRALRRVGEGQAGFDDEEWTDAVEATERLVSDGRVRGHPRRRRDMGLTLA